jgi:hypothetical protein
MEAAHRVGLAELSHYPSLHRLFHSHLVPSLIEQQREILREVFDRCPVKGTWTGVKDWLYLYQRLFRNLNFSHYAKLAFVEARNPWLARDILRFCEKLPEHYRYDKALFRKTLAFMFPELMQKVPIACHHSLEDWGTVLRADRAFGRFARKHLVECSSPLHELWNPTALGLLIDRFYAGKSIEPARICTLSRIKSFVRTQIPPLYRALKKTSPRALAVASFAPEQVIGRLLTLKLWCDRYA